MKLIENMTLSELRADIAAQDRRISASKAALEKIHGQHDYSDELAKHFHLGKVGFRKDSKRQSRTLDRAIDNGVKACGHYDTISDGESRKKSLEGAVAFIEQHAGADETEAATVRALKERQHAAAVEAAQELPWEKVKGFHGPVYRYRGIEVERVEPGFVAIRNSAGKLLDHKKTVKEAKAYVAMMVDKVTARRAGKENA